MKKNSALVVVDMQNDFCPGGALPVAGGDRVVPVINRYISLFVFAGRPVYVTRDWHPEVSVHFRASGGEWPEHCVMETEGARFHPDLSIPEDAVIITKGDDPEVDAYSAFQGHDSSGRPFLEVLKAAGVEHLFIGGLATDYCVRSTVLDALSAGLGATVLTDAVRGVDLKEGDSEKALDEMTSKGAGTATIDDLEPAG